MKKPTMKDFRWIGKPAVWKKDYRSLSLLVEPHMKMPSGPLLQAVTDDDFVWHVTLGTAPEGCRTGLCIFQSERTYATLGSGGKAMTGTVSIDGFVTVQEQTITPGQTEPWRLERTGNLLCLSKGTTVMETRLPGSDLAISFGCFWSNETEESYEGSMTDLHFEKKIRKTPYPL